MSTNLSGSVKQRVWGTTSKAFGRRTRDSFFFIFCFFLFFFWSVALRASWDKAKQPYIPRLISNSVPFHFLLVREWRVVGPLYSITFNLPEGSCKPEDRKSQHLPNKSHFWMNQEMYKGGIYLHLKLCWHLLWVWDKYVNVIWGKVIMARHSGTQVEQLRTQFSYQFYLISFIPSVWFIGRFNNTHKHYIWALQWY